MASEIRVNKIENRSGLGTVTFADTGVDLAGIVTATTFSGSGASLTNLPAANVTGTLPAISGANLTNLPAANLTGALPAISGANLTGIAATDNVRTGILDVAGVSTFRNTMNVGAAVTISESGIEASGIGITVANINGAQLGGRRNLVINGAMQVAQRGTSSTSTGFQTCDRWRVKTVGTDNLAMTISQDATSYPADFKQCLKIDITTAETALASDEYLQVQQKIEAQNLGHINNGTSDAKSLVLSFYVKAYQAGNYVVAVYKEDNTARIITLPYTINASATWERKVLVIPGDTSGGGIDSNNGVGINLDWFLAAGSDYTSSDTTSWGNHTNAGYAYGQSVNTMSSTDNYWQITGVQLEVGSEATAFEHRSFGEELDLCYRYYQRYTADGNSYRYLCMGSMDNDSNVGQFYMQFLKPFRSAVSTMDTTGTAGDYAMRRDSTQTCTSVPALYATTTHSAYITFTVSGVGWATGDALSAVFKSSSSYLGFSAEL